MQHNFITRLGLADGTTLDARLIKEAQRKRPGFTPREIKSISFLPIDQSITRGAIIMKRPDQRVLWGYIPLLPMNFAGGSEPLYPRSIGHFVILADNDGADDLKRAEIGCDGINRNQVFKDRIERGDGIQITVNGDTGAVSTQGSLISTRSESLISFGGRSIMVQIVKVV